MKRTIVAAAIALSLVGQSVQAGTVAGFGGATEVTQIMNNVQLVMSYVEQVETALYSAKQYKLMLDQIKRNPADFAKTMLKGRVEDHLRNADSAVALIDALEGLHRRQGGILDEMIRAYSTMSEMGRMGYEMDLSTYQDAMSELARQRGGEYERRYTQYRENLAGAQKDIEEINRIVAASESMTTEIQGLQSVVASNAVVANLLMRQISAINEKEAVGVANQRDYEMQMEYMRKIEQLRDERFMRDFQSIFGTSSDATSGDSR